MNNSQLDGVNNDDVNAGKDLFGMELAYNATFPTGGNTGNVVQHNGNISSMKWSQNLGLSLVKDLSYNYTYDALNRITSATYLKDTLANWTNVKNSFNESGYSYDLNGNITALTRKGFNGSSLDILTYNYGPVGNTSNQLLSVGDIGDKTKGFVDGVNTGNDYTYDPNGNMVSDQNKGLTAVNALQYNYLNLPIQVTKNTNEYIKYIYDASGRKLSQLLYSTSGVLKKKTDYNGEFYYENDSLKFINHEEGRILMTPVVSTSTLLTNPDCTSLTGFSLYGTTATLSSVTQNSQTYIKVVCTSASTGPGVNTSSSIAIVGGEHYRLVVQGYSGTAPA